ncbi:hypothetical protein GEMRC1_001506 [Eukaryota sp. GEM-RC1]
MGNDFDTAFRAFVRYSDFAGIQLIKKLKSIRDVKLREAEICLFFGNSSEAENIYLALGRKDLAADLQRKLGNYHRALDLTSDDSLLKRETLLTLGYQYFDRADFSQASIVFEECHAYEPLAKCYFESGNYAGLIEIARKLPDNHPLLPELAEQLAAGGFAVGAAETSVKAGNVDRAVDICMEFSEWELVVDFSRKYKVNNLMQKLDRITLLTIESGDVLGGINMWIKSQRFSNVAKLLVDLGKILTRKRLGQKIAELPVLPQLKGFDPSKNVNFLFVKKLFVLAALQFNNERAVQLASNKTRSTLDGFLNFEANLSKDFFDFWRPSIAIHLLLLVQRHIYSEEFNQALVTATTLFTFHDIIPKVHIASLLVLSALYAKRLDCVSSALTSVETDDTIDSDTREVFTSFGFLLFKDREPSPLEPPFPSTECLSCQKSVSCLDPYCECGAVPLFCIASGQRISFTDEIWRCSRCNQRALRVCMEDAATCPLCHDQVVLDDPVNEESAFDEELDEFI